MLKICLKKKDKYFFIGILIFAVKTADKIVNGKFGNVSIYGWAFMQYGNSDIWCILLKVQKIDARNVPEQERQDKVGLLNDKYEIYRYCNLLLNDIN